MTVILAAAHEGLHERLCVCLRGIVFRANLCLSLNGQS